MSNPLKPATDQWGVGLPSDLVRNISQYPYLSYCPSLNLYFNSETKQWLYSESNKFLEATFAQVHPDLAYPQNYTQLVQNYIQSNQTELAKSADSFRRSQEDYIRISAKASNKIQLARWKQQARKTYFSFVPAADGFHVITKNGLGETVDDVLVFSVSLQEISLVTRNGDPIGLRIKAINLRRSCAEEFTVKLSNTSVSELKKSPFFNFYIPSPKYERYAWDCMLQYLTNNQADRLEIPSFPGWWQDPATGSVTFWASRPDREFAFLPENIARISLRQAETRSCSDSIISKLLSISNHPQHAKISALLIFRVAALLLPLWKQTISFPTLCLLGGKAIDVASQTLLPVTGIQATINLDSDNKSTIRNRIHAYSRCMPALCFTRCSGDRTPFRRFDSICSQVADGGINTFAVLCLNQLDARAELSDIIMDIRGLSSSDFKGLFDEISLFIIQKIEKSGRFGPDYYEQSILKISDEDGESSEISIIVSLLEEILRIQSNNEISAFLQAGKALITQQLKDHYQVLLEVFRDTTIEAVTKDRVNIIDRRAAPFNNREGKIRIYYDDEYYYFTRDCLRKICEYAEISEKGILKIKQDLFFAGYLKYYSYSESHREYNIDFVCTYAAGTEYLSGIAVSAAFFDTAFGIKLYERGSRPSC